MDNFGILSLIPPIFAIVMAFITKQTIISLFGGVFIGALMLANWNPVAAVINMFSDFIFPTIGSEWNQTIVLLIFFIGAFSLMIEKGGGANAFATRLSKKVKTRKQGKILTWLGGVGIFFGDASSPVLVGPIFRPLTDQLKISREKLAYIVDSTSATMPVLFPFTAWGAFVISIISAEFDRVGFTGNPLTSFMQAIPYQYYTIGAILAVFMFAVTGIDFGPMKKAEDRALNEGKLLADDAVPLKPSTVVELPEDSTPTMWDMLTPLIVLIVVLFAMFLYTGDFPNKSVLQALGNSNSMLSLNVAFFIAGIVAMFYTFKSKVFTFTEAWNVYMEGMEQMVEAVFVLIFAWAIGSVCGAVGTSDYVVSIAENVLTPTTMLVTIFTASAFTAFTTGSSWGPFAIFLPISIPLAIAIDVPMGAAVAVVLSGGIFGDHCSPISDTTILSSMGSSSDHLHHVRTQLPYALLVAFAAGIVYLIAGFTNGPIIGLITTLVLILAGILIGGKYESMKETKNQSSSA